MENDMQDIFKENASDKGSDRIPESDIATEAETSRDSGLSSELFCRYSDTALLMELDRYGTLSAAASKLMLFIPLAALALIAVAALFAQGFATAGATKVIALVALVAAVPLIGSLCTLLCSQFLFRYELPASLSGPVQREALLRIARESSSGTAYANALEATYRSLRERNKAVEKLVKASTICLFAAIALAVAASIVGVCLLPA